MSALAALNTGVGALEAIADFLDDHPGVEIYHRNYRKLPLARTHLRNIRSAAREARQQQLSRHQRRAIVEIGQIVDWLLQRVHEIKKADFRREVQSLAEKVAGLIPGDELPQLPKFPRRTPNWIKDQVRRDYQEISKCYCSAPD